MGAALAVIGAAGITLAPLLGWTEVAGPWDFVAGFVFGVSAGAGVALAIAGLMQLRGGPR
jgi:hypothetical protein